MVTTVSWTVFAFTIKRLHVCPPELLSGGRLSSLLHTRSISCHWLVNVCFRTDWNGDNGRSLFNGRADIIFGIVAFIGAWHYDRIFRTGFEIRHGQLGGVGRLKHE